mmetsp:Transcript_8158/g.18305  ORF Transcript_8158/g.18305 Transcript_8158/m.18305 type:complete len:449 (+) Transcript_8158:50-1396(+)
MRATTKTLSKSMEYLSPVWTHLTKMQPVKGSGIYLWDAAGQRYTDFSSGIGVVNTGHCHPAVVQAVQDQAKDLIFGQMNIVVPPATVELTHQLRQAMAAAPATSQLDTFFFANSGAEAVEASVKLARHATGKRNIIVFQGSFHGRTHQTMAMTTAKYIYRVNYQPLPSGVFVSPYPYTHYYNNGTNKENQEERVVDFCLKELQTLLLGQTQPEETAAIIIEPVLGEGGYVQAPPRFMQELRRLCDQHNILLIADEVQSGVGRTGKMFSVEHIGGDAKPDILIMAKGLGSGLPISGIAARRELMEHWQPGSHGGTYGGGSAIASAAARATLQVIRDENLLDNATQRGHQLVQGFQALQQKYGDTTLTDVRGCGLMVATELANKEMAKAVQQACLQRNLLVLTCGTYENSLRWIPPLIVTSQQVEEALEIMDEAMAQVLVGDKTKSKAVA